MTEHALGIPGKGPAGLMLAGELALARVDVAIVELRASQDLAGSRAGGLHSRTIEVRRLPCNAQKVGIRWATSRRPARDRCPGPPPDAPQLWRRYLAAEEAHGQHRRRGAQLPRHERDQEADSAGQREQDRRVADTRRSRLTVAVRPSLGAAGADRVSAGRQPLSARHGDSADQTPPVAEAASRGDCRSPPIRATEFPAARQSRTQRIDGLVAAVVMAVQGQACIGLPARSSRQPSVNRLVACGV